MARGCRQAASEMARASPSGCGPAAAAPARAAPGALPGSGLTLFEKRIQGALFGGGNPFKEIPRMLDLYRDGRLKLDELVTTRYRLEEVNQGYQDLRDGKNIRGLIVHEP
jgi:Zn-dependent alcohol dehydrogenase